MASLSFFVYASESAEDVTFPEDMLVVDLTQPPYNADPSGTTDSTAAIQKALADHSGGNNWTLYLPNGVYSISDTLDWGDGARMGPTLQGQSRDRTTIKLKDSCKAFGQGKPTPLMTIVQRKSADAFCMAIRELTIDTGKGNPDAIGLQFMSNNQGGLRNVLIKSGDGQGIIGLDMSFNDMIGPLLVKNVEVKGFEIGIATSRQVNSMTFEHVRLSGQRRIGLLNDGQCVSIRGLVSKNSVTAVENRAGSSLMVLIDSELQGVGDSIDRPAIVNDGHCFIRNVRTPGYATPLKSSVGSYAMLDDDEIGEFVSDQVRTLSPSLHHSLGLPIEETPEVERGELAGWVNVQDFGANTRDDLDDTEAIQRAIDSGAHTIYFPQPMPSFLPGQPRRAGRYQIDGTVRVRGNAARIIGAGGRWDTIRIGGETRDGAFVIEDGVPPVVIFEDLNIVDGPTKGSRCPVISHKSSRTVVLRHVNTILHNSLYVGVPGAGKAFFEDVSSHFPKGKKDQSGGDPHYYFAEGQQIWARQLNPEKGFNKIVNDGADFWVLGLKTEKLSTVIETRNGGRSEVLGGLVYPSLPGEGNQQMIRVLDSACTAVIGEAGFHRRYDTLVYEERSGEVRELKRGDALGRAGGSVLPLFSANVQPTRSQIGPPSNLQLTPEGTTSMRLAWAGPQASDLAFGEYVVYRDGQEIGRTRKRKYLDTDLQDDKPYAYRVVALDRGARPVGDTNATASTLRDTEPPQTLSATYGRYPPHINLRFNEPVQLPANTSHGSISTNPTMRVSRIEVAEDTRELFVLLEEAEELPDSITFEGIADHASMANSSGLVTVPVVVPVQPEPVLSHDFGGSKAGDKPVGVRDESAWNKGAKADLSIRVNEVQGNALRVGFNPFAQVILGSTPLERGRSYRLSVRLAANEKQQVIVQVRRATAPYTIYGGISETIGPQPQTVSTSFIANESDESAQLYLILRGNGAISLSKAQLLRMPTADELNAPPDKTPPQLISAQSLTHPDRIAVRCSERMATEPALRLENYLFTPTTRIEEIEQSTNGKVVELKLADGAPVPDTILIEDQRDVAPRSNHLEPKAVDIVAGPKPEILKHEDFEGVAADGLPPGVRDNSRWNKGAQANLRVIEGDDGNHLRIGSERFAQVVLARLPIKPGNRYRVFAIVSTELEPTEVTFIVRRFNAPYITSARRKVRVGIESRQGLILDFEPDVAVQGAALLVEIQGKASINIDDLVIAVEQPEVN